MISNFIKDFPMKLSETEIKLLEEYLEELMRWNTKINLISRKLDSDVIIKEHVLFSYNFLRFCSDEVEYIIDLGSGNGIPGIPLAISLKNEKVYLVERREKKLAFLIYVKNKLMLGNVEVYESYEESIKDVGDGKFLVVARAVGDIDESLKLLKSYDPKPIALITTKSASKIKDILDKYKDKVEIEDILYPEELREKIKLVRVKL